MKTIIDILLKLSSILPTVISVVRTVGDFLETVRRVLPSVLEGVERMVKAAFGEADLATCKIK